MLTMRYICWANGDIGFDEKKGIRGPFYMRQEPKTNANSQPQPNKFDDICICRWKRDDDDDIRMSWSEENGAPSATSH